MYEYRWWYSVHTGSPLMSRPCLVEPTRCSHGNIHGKERRGKKKNRVHSGVRLIGDRILRIERGTRECDHASHLAAGLLTVCCGVSINGYTYDLLEVCGQVYRFGVCVGNLRGVLCIDEVIIGCHREPNTHRLLQSLCLSVWEKRNGPVFGVSSHGLLQENGKL